MTLPQSGKISIMNLVLEFDDTHPSPLSDFYGDGNGPASGTVNLSDYYSTAATGRTTSGLLFELDARDSNSWGGSGTTWSDLTSNNRDFTLVNGPSGTNEIDFDGSNDYAHIADATCIREGNQAFTAEAYVKIDSFTYGSHNGNDRFLFSKSSTSNEAFALGFSQTSSTQLYMIATTQGSGNLDGNVHRYDMGNQTSWTGAYHHFVWTYDGDTLKFYIDATLEATFTGRTFGNNSAPMRLMALDPNNGAWGLWVDGKARVVRYYDDELTGAEVTTNYNNCTGGVAPTASTLSVTPTSHVNSAFTATFQFNERVADFTTDDITVTNATKGAFTAVDRDTYTLALTPSGTSDITVQVPTTASFNAGNLGNNAINQTITYSILPTSNLYMDLDAGNSNSYGGSGTTWYDATSNNNDFSLVNGPTFVSSSPKHFSFDGSNDWGYRQFTVSSQSETTWIVWHRPHNATQNSWSALLGIRYGSTSQTNILGFKNSNQYHYQYF